MTHKSSLAAACVSLTGIRLGAEWRAEDGKYVLNLLLCPTADPRAWERSCWSPLPHTSSVLSSLGLLIPAFPCPSIQSCIPTWKEGRRMLKETKRQWGQQAAPPGTQHSSHCPRNKKSLRIFQFIFFRLSSSNKQKFAFPACSIFLSLSPGALTGAKCGDTSQTCLRLGVGPGDAPTVSCPCPGYGNCRWMCPSQ